MEITKEQSLTRIDTIKSFFEMRIKLDDVSNRERRLMKTYIEGLSEVRGFIVQKPEKVVLGGLKGLILSIKLLFKKQK